MSYPRITLGGIPIDIRNGEVSEADDPLTAAVVVRMGEGGGVKLTHWKKAAGSIAGAGGWIPAALDGLDYSQPLELLLTSPETMAQLDTEFVLHCDFRPDKEPWAYAEVDGSPVRTPCTAVGRNVTVTPVVGAARYIVQWMPRYWVFAEKPPRERSRSYAWSIPWEEV